MSFDVFIPRIPSLFHLARVLDGLVARKLLHRSSLAHGR
jgi:hypothetical protein